MLTHFKLNKLPYTNHILEESNFSFRNVGLCDVDNPREKLLNYLQIMETLSDCPGRDPNGFTGP